MIALFDKHNVAGMFLFNRRDYVDLRNTDPTGSLPYRRQGIAGRVSYNWNQRYFAEFNFGYNGSEQFPKGKRYGFFPSISLGYVITNEDFWNPEWAVSNLKIRGSYGEVGNDISNSARFLYLTTMNMHSATIRSVRMATHIWKVLVKERLVILMLRGKRLRN